MKIVIWTLDGGNSSDYERLNKSVENIVKGCHDTEHLIWKGPKIDIRCYDTEDTGNHCISTLESIAEPIKQCDLSDGPCCTGLPLVQDETLYRGYASADAYWDARRNGEIV